MISKTIWGGALTLAFGAAVAVFIGACGSGAGTPTVPNKAGVARPAPPALGTITAFVNAGGGNITVMSVNSLAAGSVVTISGTTNYNGIYTVVSALPQSFTITATFVANDAAGLWTAVGGLLAGCSTTGATGFITLASLASVPSRFTGVAPLAVFFDATATSAVNIARPFHDLEFRWTFGDGGSGNWSNGARTGVSRNTATGPVAAHVFETPGTYTITVTVTDGTNTVTNSCIQIAVQDPNVVFAGNKTVCFSTSGTFGADCPSGATEVTTSNFTTAISTHQGTGKRLLFRRGETFDSASNVEITATGPGIVGAFPVPPTATLAKVRATGNNTMLALSSATTPTIKDWRVMDLEMDGQSGAQAAGTGGGGGIDQVLLLRLNIHHVGNGISFGTPTLDFWNDDANPARHGHKVWDQLAIVDTTVSQSSGGTGMFIASGRLALLGSLIDTVPTGHVVRITYIGKGVVSNNTMRIPGSGLHTLKIHAGTFGGTGVTGGGRYTEQVVISDNQFVGANNDFTVTLEPQHNNIDERMREILVERNWFRAGVGTREALVISAVDVTVRNNICNTSGGTANHCFTIGQRGIEPPPNQIRVQNNTCYSANTGGFDCVFIGATASNVTVQNNLGSAPSATSPSLIVGTGASGLVSSNNLLNNSPAVLFVSATPSAVEDFLLAGGSPARNAGLNTVPVFSDFFRTDRPQASVIDIGAVEAP